MSDYPWSAYYYVDYQSQDQSSNRLENVKEPEKEYLEIILAVAMPILMILGFIG